MARKQQGFVIEEGRDDLPTFLHSELDDALLDADEMRVYLRMSRRAGNTQGEHFESIDSMVAYLIIGEHKIRRAITALCLYRLIERLDRPGQTSIFRLLPRSKWRLDLVPEVRRTRLTRYQTATGKLQNRHGLDVTEQSHEGSPVQGNPHKEDVSSAPSIDGEPVQLIAYLNEKSGRKFEGSEADLGHIRARLAEGKTLEQLKLVVDHRVCLWKHEPSMAIYLRPETLFGRTTRIKDYIEVALEWSAAGRPGKRVRPQIMEGDPEAAEDPESPQARLVKQRLEFLDRHGRAMNADEELVAKRAVGLA